MVLQWLRAQPAQLRRREAGITKPRLVVVECIDIPCCTKGDERLDRVQCVVVAHFGELASKVLGKVEVELLAERREKIGLLSRAYT